MDYFELSRYAFVVGFAATCVAMLLYALSLFGTRTAQAMGLAGGGTLSTSNGTAEAAGRLGTMAALNAFAFLTASLVLRGIEAGHGPFSNMYEFAVAFAWGSLGVYLYFEFRYRMRVLAVLVMPVTIALLTYAAVFPSDEIDPLVPALQNDLLLTIHVIVAIIAYGAFAVSFGAACLYLTRDVVSLDWIPSGEVLEEIGYKSVMFAFPLMALVIILGAVWAEIAWGRYWSWDPKETSALVTWLIYGGYLHARVVRGWRGTRSAVLLILAFATLMMTFFGNYFLGGLHSYG